jgi:hypothetical protein
MVEQRQRLDGGFSGTEHLGTYAGDGPKTVGAICDEAEFSGVVKVQPGILGPRNGAVAVDLPVPHRLARTAPRKPRVPARTKFPTPRSCAPPYFSVTIVVDRSRAVATR